MFFVSIHFKDNLVCWFVWHYTPVSATSGMDIYANTFRVRSAAAQEKGKWKAGFWGGRCDWKMNGKAKYLFYSSSSFGWFLLENLIDIGVIGIVPFGVFPGRRKMRPFCNNWVPGTSLWQIGQIHLLYSPPHTRLSCAYLPMHCNESDHLWFTWEKHSQFKSLSLALKRIW